MLNDVTFVRNVQGLGAPLPGADFISGITFYNDTPPVLFPANVTGGGIVKCFQLQDAENAGIVDTYPDETRGTGTYLVTAVGADGDTVSLYFTEPDGTAVLLGTYTKVAADTTTTLVATGIKDAINARTIQSGGYTATSSTGTVTVTFRPGLGVFPNTGTPFSATVVGTITGTLTQSVVDGVASKLAVYHYHISEFFRMQPQGILYVGIFDLPGSLTAPTFSEITTMQQFSNDNGSIGSRPAAA